jgi:flagellar hook-basal body complex protein FliE
MSDITMNSVLGELRRLTALAKGEPGVAGTTAPGDFASLLKSMLDNVSATQESARRLADAFELEDGKVDLAEVMITQQKARLAFQTTLQVRNKLVAAYQDIMNMPI